MFKYAESGYCAMEKGQACGIKIHNAFLVDKLAPVAISITTGNGSCALSIETLIIEFNWQ